MNLNLSLELIKCNKLPFGGMPEMVTVNFLQLPSDTHSSVFQVPESVDYNLLAGNLWLQLLKLLNITKVVRQNSTLEFAGISNTIWGL